MSEREERLRELTAELGAHDAIDDAFLAKSFTDRLVILDVEAGETVPGAIEDRLAAHGIRPAAEVYQNEGSRFFAGDVGDATRHHFVDTETRGTHQSYVVE